jgi:hypothetical protein
MTAMKRRDITVPCTLAPKKPRYMSVGAAVEFIRQNKVVGMHMRECDHCGFWHIWKTADLSTPED